MASENLTRTQVQVTPARRLVAAGIKRGTGPLLVEQPQRVKLLDIKHGFGQLAPSMRDLLETAATIADETTFPAGASVTDRILRLFLGRAASQLIAPLQQVATKAERQRDRLLWQQPSQAKHDALDDADRLLYDARSRVYVARQQVDKLVEDAIDDIESLLAGITIGDLAGLLRLAAADTAAHAAASHVRRPAMTA
ncbi:hypothetical protein [Streptomyces goshikiensis]|uniref:hypothetical protein n=1 Tax=Streptomyces goshikiensis TaxID=1942 RepID=UPI002E0F8785|nr:hypothetical protein OG224_06825 [Streptomyces goshikiensis]